MRTIVIILTTLLAFCTQAPAQTPEELIAIHAAHLAAMNAHDLDTVMSFWADEGIYDLVSSPPPVPKAYVRAGFAARFAAYPDFHMTMGRVLAAGNIIVEEGKTVYTDTATGIEVNIPHISIYEFVGDKIKKVTSYNDRLSIMVTLGQVPAPDMPPLVPSVNIPDPEPTGLSAMEANAELISRWNSHDAAGAAKMDSADYQIFAGPLGASLDRAAMTAVNELYFTSFPDVQIEVVRAVELEDGWVLTELRSKGTHKGDFMGVPASGYLTGLRVVWLTRYDADGLAVEQSFYYDNLTLVNQMTTVPYSLDGFWVTAAPTPFGNFISKTLYVSQDADKTRYSGTLEFINSFPLFTEIYPDANPSLSFSVGGQAAMVGRDRYEATYLSYDRKFDESTGVMDIVGINSLKAYFEVIGPDFLYGYGTCSYYLAAQDADQDGFPDEGQEPAACIPWGWTSKRLTAMPECAATP